MRWHHPECLRILRDLYPVHDTPRSSHLSQTTRYEKSLFQVQNSVSNWLSGSQRTSYSSSSTRLSSASSHPIHTLRLAAAKTSDFPPYPKLYGAPAFYRLQYRSGTAVAVPSRRCSQFYRSQTLPVRWHPPYSLTRFCKT